MNIRQEIKELILNPSEINHVNIAQIFNKLKRKNVDYADMYFQYSKNEYFAIEDGQVKNTTFNIDNGCGLRAVSGEKTAFAYTDEVSLKTLQDSSDIVKALESSGQNKSIPLIQNKTQRALYIQSDPTLAPTLEKIEILKKIEKMAFAKDARIKKVNASIAAEYDAILIVNSESNFQSDIRPLVRLSLSIIVEHNGRREIGTAGGGGRFNVNYFNEEVMNLYINEAYDQAITNLDAVASPAGLMTVVLGPGWPGILLHEAIGHGLRR